MQVENWASVVVSSLQDLLNGIAGSIANILGALIVFVIGLIVASGLGKLVEKIIELVRLDKLLASLGLNEHLERAGLKLNSGKFFGKLTYWFFVIVFLLAASDILHFTALSQFLQAVLLYIPNVLVAVLIMLAAIVVGNFLKNLVHASVKSSKLKGARFLGSLTWWAIIVFGFLAAVSQLGVARDIINIVVTGFVAMLALAGGIAFGLGGKDYASYLMSRLREHHEG